MSRAAVLPLSALALALSGCPLPQPLPEYSAGTVTPPRILADQQLAPIAGDYPGVVTLIPADCVTTAPSRVLSARIVDTNTVESVEARWFVNYDHRDPIRSEVRASSIIPPFADPAKVVRDVPAWTFFPYNHPPPPGTPFLLGPPYPQPGVLRVVELVVSNGFDPAIAGTAQGANRFPKPTFETQVYRWVFLTVPESAAVPCP